MPLIELNEEDITEIECRLSDSLGWQEYSIDNSGSISPDYYITAYTILERDKTIIETILNKLKGINNA